MIHLWIWDNMDQISSDSEVKKWKKKLEKLSHELIIHISLWITIRVRLNINSIKRIKWMSNVICAATKTYFAVIVKCYSRKIDEYVPPNHKNLYSTRERWTDFYLKYIISKWLKKKKPFVMQHKFDPKILVSFP